jgi:hypothetical protein
MNERIKQLAEQARAEVRADWAKGNKIPYPEAHYAFQRDTDQKFAELIVRECISQVVSDPDIQAHNEIKYAVGRIKQHFGVEK